LFEEIDTESEAELIYHLYLLLWIPNLDIEVFSNFIFVYVWDSIFIIFFDPSLKYLNQISLYLQEEWRADKKHIFILTDIRFFSYIQQQFSTKADTLWLNQIFAKLLKFSHYMKDLSD